MPSDVNSSESRAARTWHRGVTLASVSDAALRVLDRDGRAALTMRRLAAELDVAPPSLYAHVASKAALIDLVLERVLAGVELPPLSEHPQGDLIAGFVAYRRALLNHPEAALLLVEEPRLSAVSVRLVERSLGLLTGLGLPLDEAVDRHVAAVAFMLGWVFQELMPAKVAPGISLDAPLLAAAMEQVRTQGADERFAKGLRLILDCDPIVR